MNYNSLDTWNNYFNDIGIKSELYQEYLPFISSCIERKIPPIFEIEHLALLLGRDLSTLLSMIEGSKSFYRTFRLRKRSGGTRVIQAPYPSLLEVQRWINTNILETTTLPNCVTGFRKKYSIIDNARIHCGRDEIIKIDIENFFPSINFRRVIFVFLSLGYPLNVSYSLAKLCTLNNQLPQGAATSPTLSNIICGRMDQRFYSLCKSKKLRYTRYADDISISGKDIPFGIQRLFFEIIENEGFKINQKKFRFLKPGDKKIITGLDITSGKPRVTRAFRREIQKDIYFVWSVGLATHLARRKIFAPNYIDQLDGRIQFWASVEPENPQMKKLLERVKHLKNIYQI